MILLRGGRSISTSSLVKTLRKYSLNVRDIFFRILCCFFFNTFCCGFMCMRKEVKKLECWDQNFCVSQ